MYNLPDEVLVVIYSFLAVVDLLAVRKVSVRLGRVAGDKRLWRGAKIAGVKFYRDKKYHWRTGEEEGVNLGPRGGVTSEEFGWIFSRVREARFHCFLGAKYNTFMEDMFLHIIREQQKDEELQLKKLDLSYCDNLDQVDDQLLARILAKIQTVNLNTSGI